MNFEFQQNNDGSFAIYNNEIGDIYYSNIGAHNEAMQKFVIPADVTSLKSQKIKILDICYGMGYNSKTFVDYCVKNNYNFEFEIDCVELDKNILSFLTKLSLRISSLKLFSFSSCLKNTFKLFS